MFFQCLRKCLLFLLILLPVERTAAAGEPASWTLYQAPFKGDHITVVHPASISGERARIEWLITMADRSTVTTDPIGTATSGLISARDVVVVTNDLLMWFNCETPESVSTNGGGGMLRGIWTLHLDGSNSLNFKRITNANNYASSYFYAGSEPGIQGSGISLLGNFGMQNVDNGVTYAIEHEHAPAMTPVTGTTIPSGDHVGGVFVQFTGRLANSSISEAGLQELGLSDHYDCDARPDITGQCEYTLTYRVPLSGESFRQEITLNVTRNNLGPCATMVLSHNIAGYPDKPAVFVADQQLSGNGITDNPNQYFTTPGKNLHFYTLPWTSRPGTNSWWETSSGTGTLAGVGLPDDPQPVPFFDFSPAITALPPHLQSSYALQFIDNQGANSAHRCLALDLQLWDVNRGTQPQVFPQGSELQITTDYQLHYRNNSNVPYEQWKKQ